MRISSRAYMSVETLVRLATQNADRPCTAKGLAEWINRSVSYTEGLMARLRSAGLVVSRQGPNGGYVLAKPAHRITVAEVFQAVDESSDRPDRRSDAAAPEAEEIDDLHGTELLREALTGHVLLFLNRVSLSDLAPPRAEAIGDHGEDQAPPHPPASRSTAPQ